MTLKLKCQSELAILWRTLSLIRYCDDEEILDQYCKDISFILNEIKLSTGSEELFLNDHESNKYAQKLNFDELVYLNKLNSGNDDENISSELDGIVYPLFDVFIDYHRKSKKSLPLYICIQLAIKFSKPELLFQILNEILTRHLNSSQNTTINTNTTSEMDDFISVDILIELYEYITAMLGISFDFESIKTTDISEEYQSILNISRPNSQISVKNSIHYHHHKNDNTCNNDNDMNHINRTNNWTNIMSFGKSEDGKLGLADIYQTVAIIPTPVINMSGIHIVKIASMSAYTLAIDDMGHVYIWGTGGSYRLRTPSDGVITTPIPRHHIQQDIYPRYLHAISTQSIITDIACGLGHTLLRTLSGQVLSWGNGTYGKLGHGDTKDQSEACLITALKDIQVIKVICGAYHSLVLTSEGHIYSWGKNSQGQCGHGHMDDVYTPMKIHDLQSWRIIDIAAGWEHSLAVTIEGHLYTWGSGYKDSRRGIIPPVLGLGNIEGRLSPERVTLIENIKIMKVASGWDHCLALDSHGKILSWGSGSNGKLGHGNEENMSIPLYISSIEHLKFTSVSTGCEHSAAVTEYGALYTWGHGEGGRLGHGDYQRKLQPTPVKYIEYMNSIVQEVYCGDKFTIALVDLKKESADSNNSSDDDKNKSQIKVQGKASQLRRLKLESVCKGSQSWYHSHIFKSFQTLLPTDNTTRNPNTMMMNKSKMGVLLLSFLSYICQYTSSFIPLTVSSQPNNVDMVDTFIRSFLISPRYNVNILQSLLHILQYLSEQYTALTQQKEYTELRISSNDLEVNMNHMFSNEFGSTKGDNLRDISSIGMSDKQSPLIVIHSQSLFLLTILQSHMKYMHKVSSHTSSVQETKQPVLQTVVEKDIKQNQEKLILERRSSSARLLRYSSADNVHLPRTLRSAESLNQSQRNLRVHADESTSEREEREDESTVEPNNVDSTNASHTTIDMRTRSSNTSSSNTSSSNTNIMESNINSTESSPRPNRQLTTREEAMMRARLASRDRLHSRELPVPTSRSMQRNTSRESGNMSSNNNNNQEGQVNTFPSSRLNSAPASNHIPTGIASLSDGVITYDIEDQAEVDDMLRGVEQQNRINTGRSTSLEAIQDEETDVSSHMNALDESFATNALTHTTHSSIQHHILEDDDDVDDNDSDDSSSDDITTHFQDTLLSESLQHSIFSHLNLPYPSTPPKDDIFELSTTQDNTDISRVINSISLHATDMDTSTVSPLYSHVHSPLPHYDDSADGRVRGLSPRDEDEYEYEQLADLYEVDENSYHGVYDSSHTESHSWEFSTDSFQHNYHIHTDADRLPDQLSMDHEDESTSSTQDDRPPISESDIQAYNDDDDDDDDEDVELQRILMVTSHEPAHDTQSALNYDFLNLSCIQLTTSISDIHCQLKQTLEYLAFTSFTFLEDMRLFPESQSVPSFKLHDISSTKVDKSYWYSTHMNIWYKTQECITTGYSLLYYTNLQTDSDYILQLISLSSFSPIRHILPGLLGGILKTCYNNNNNNNNHNNKEVATIPDSDNSAYTVSQTSSIKSSGLISNRNHYTLKSGAEFLLFSTHFETIILSDSFHIAFNNIKSYFLCDKILIPPESLLDPLVIQLYYEIKIYYSKQYITFTLLLLAHFRLKNTFQDNDKILDDEKKLIEKYILLFGALYNCILEDITHIYTYWSNYCMVQTTDQIKAESYRKEHSTGTYHERILEYYIHHSFLSHLSILFSVIFNPFELSIHIPLIQQLFTNINQLYQKDRPSTQGNTETSTAKSFWNSSIWSDMMKYLQPLLSIVIHTLYKSKHICDQVDRCRIELLHKSCYNHPLRIYSDIGMKYQHLRLQYFSVLFNPDLILKHALIKEPNNSKDSYILGTSDLRSWIYYAIKISDSMSEINNLNSFKLSNMKTDNIGDDDDDKFQLTVACVDQYCQNTLSYLSGLHTLYPYIIKNSMNYYPFLYETSIFWDQLGLSSTYQWLHDITIISTENKNRQDMESLSIQQIIISTDVLISELNDLKVQLWYLLLSIFLQDKLMNSIHDITSTSIDDSSMYEKIQSLEDIRYLHITYVIMEILFISICHHILSGDERHESNSSLISAVDTAYGRNSDHNSHAHGDTVSVIVRSERQIVYFLNYIRRIKDKLSEFLMNRFLCYNYSKDENNTTYNSDLMIYFSPLTDDMFTTQPSIPTTVVPYQAFIDYFQSIQSHLFSTLCELDVTNNLIRPDNILSSSNILTRIIQYLISPIDFTSLYPYTVSTYLSHLLHRHSISIWSWLIDDISLHPTLFNSCYPYLDSYVLPLRCKPENIDKNEVISYLYNDFNIHCHDGTYWQDCTYNTILVMQKLYNLISKYSDTVRTTTTHNLFDIIIKYLYAFQQFYPNFYLDSSVVVNKITISTPPLYSTISPNFITMHFETIQSIMKMIQYILSKSICGDKDTTLYSPKCSSTISTTNFPYALSHKLLLYTCTSIIHKLIIDVGHFPSTTLLDSTQTIVSILSQSNQVIGQILSTLRINLVQYMDNLNSYAHVGKCTYLLCGMLDVLNSDPCSTPDVYTSDGSYTLRFWVYVSSELKDKIKASKVPWNKSKSTADIERNNILHSFHLLSLLPEMYDYNLLSLLQNDSTVSSTPSISLVHEEDSVHLQMKWTAKSVSNLSRNITIEMKSHTLELDQWHQCELVIHHTVREIIDSKPKPQFKRSIKKTQSETHVSLYIDNIEQVKDSLFDTFHPSYYTVYIGSIPNSIPRVDTYIQPNNDEDGYNLDSTMWSSTRSCSNSGDLKSIHIADVIWIPTAIKSKISPKASTEKCVDNTNPSTSQVFSVPPSMQSSYIKDLWRTLDTVLNTSAVSMTQYVTLLQDNEFNMTDDYTRCIDQAIESFFIALCLGNQKIINKACASIQKYIKGLIQYINTSRNNKCVSFEKLGDMTSLSTIMLFLLQLADSLLDNENYDDCPSIPHSNVSLSDEKKVIDTSISLIHSAINDMNLLRKRVNSSSQCYEDYDLCHSYSHYMCLIHVDATSLLAHISQIVTLWLQVISLLQSFDYTHTSLYNQYQSLVGQEEYTYTMEYLIHLHSGGWPSIPDINKHILLVPRYLDSTPLSDTSSSSKESYAYICEGTIIQTSKIYADYYQPMKVMQCKGGLISPISPPVEGTDQCTSMLSPSLRNTVYDIHGIPICSSTDVCTSNLSFTELLNITSTQHTVFRIPTVIDLLKSVHATLLYYHTKCRRNHNVNLLLDLSQDNIKQIAKYKENISHTLVKLRCYLMQLSYQSKSNVDNLILNTDNSNIDTSAHNEGTSPKTQMSWMNDFITTNFKAICLLAGTNVYQTIHDIIDHYTNIAVKNVIGDILIKLLEFNDIHLFEKIALLVYSDPSSFSEENTEKLSMKSNDPNINDTNGKMTEISSISNVNTTMPATSISIPIVCVAGDVHIHHGKVRALSHFPTIKLDGCTAIIKDTGRWYYEVSLLSDGLIQLGWSYHMMKCDPMSGQGVGDYNGSWAYDGYRAKKWNVACDNYGKKWKKGDVVGVLVDMDMLEIKYFLNGEDLDIAFSDFTLSPGYGLFPALSMNVRQSVRLNFGQFRFIYPPDSIDGYPYRSVIQALDSTQMNPSKINIDTLIESLQFKGSLKNTKVNNDPSTATVTSPTHINSYKNTLLDDIYSNTEPLLMNQSQLITEDFTTRITDTNLLHSSSTASDADIEQEASYIANHLLHQLLQDLHTSDSSYTQDTTSDSGYHHQTRHHTQLREESDDLSNMSSYQPSRINDDYPSTRMSTENDDNSEEENENMGVHSDRRHYTHYSTHEPYHSTYGDHERDTQEDDDDDDEEDSDSNDEDDDDDDNNDDNEEGRHSYTHYNHRHHHTQEEGYQYSHMSNSDSYLSIQQRRQSLIENLITMGFPVEWALRAAEQCDTSTTHSSAVSWIIERMELEQNKLEDIDSTGGGDGDYSSRGGDDRDQSNSTFQRILQRNRNITTTTTTTNADTTNDNDNTMQKRQQVDNEYDYLWNTSIQYNSVLPGYYNDPHSTDKEKDYILSQLHCLEYSERMTIILICQYILHIYYSRALLMIIFSLCVQSNRCVQFAQQTTHTTILPTISEKINSQNMLYSILLTGTTSHRELLQAMKRSFGYYCHTTRKSNVTHLLPILTATSSYHYPTSNSEEYHIDILQILNSLFNSYSSSEISDSVSSSVSSSSSSTSYEDIIKRSSLFFYSYEELISDIETTVYSNYMNDMLVEEGHICGLQRIYRFICLLISYASKDIPHSGISNRMTSGDNQNKSNFRHIQKHTNMILHDLIVDSVVTFINVSNYSHGNTQDWITLATYNEYIYLHDFSTNHATSDTSNAKKEKDKVTTTVTSYSLIYAYFILKTILSSNEIKYYFRNTVLNDSPSTGQTTTKGHASRNTTESMSIFTHIELPSYYYVTELFSIHTMASLLHTLNTSNISLIYCAVDLCTIILSYINSSLSYAVTDDDNVSNQKEDGLDSFKKRKDVTATKYEFSKKGKKTGPYINQHNTAHSSSTATSSWNHFSIHKLGEDIYHKCNYYQVILQFISTRLVHETYANQVMMSPYFRSLCMYMIEWNRLCRHLNKIDNVQYIEDYMSYHEYEALQQESKIVNVSNKHQSPSLKNDSNDNVLSSKDISNLYITDDRILAVTHITSHSITIKYDLSQYMTTTMTTTTSPSTTYALYIQSLGAYYLDTVRCICTELSTIGSVYIDQIEANTMYKVYIEIISPYSNSKPSSPRITNLHSSHKEEKTISSQNVNNMTDPMNVVSSLMVSTLGDNLLALDPRNTSTSLQISADHLTVRNTVNKKWSTCRASLKMVSGVHRWDVQIDRCVSKNIFIGVCTNEAKLDNYVGCDKHGWGFLANKAIWYNKTKLKSYGELYRAGDVITTIVDLDNKTIQYLINGEEMGVAVEGISGPVYPAFSLYNEDDQITVVTSHGRSPKSELSMLGHSNVENILHRLTTLYSLIDFITSSYGSTLSPKRSKLNSLEEKLLWLRYELYMKDITVRSYLYKNEVITICKSNTLIQSFTHYHLKCDDRIKTSHGVGTVLGIYGHQLYIHMKSNTPPTTTTSSTTTEMYILSQDSFIYQWQLGLITKLENEEDIWQTLLEDHDNDMESMNSPPDMLKSSPKSAYKHRNRHQIKQPLQLSEHEFLHFLYVSEKNLSKYSTCDSTTTTTNTTSTTTTTTTLEQNNNTLSIDQDVCQPAVLMPQQSMFHTTWTIKDDIILIQWIDDISSVSHTHPLELSFYTDILYPLLQFMDIHETTSIPSIHKKSNLGINERMIQCIRLLSQKFGLQAIIIRLVLLHIINDLFNALYPIYYSTTHYQLLSTHNAISWNHLIYHTIKQDLIAKTCQSTIQVHYTPSTETQSTCIDKSVDKVNDMTKSITDDVTRTSSLSAPSDKLVLYLDTMKKNNHTHDDTNDTYYNLSDPCRRLIQSFETSYIGRFFRFLQTAAHLSYEYIPTHSTVQMQSKTVWEDVLRQFCLNEFNDREIPPSARPVPFLIRLSTTHKLVSSINEHNSEKTEPVSTNKIERDEINTLEILLKDKLCTSSSIDIISEWNIFCVFVQECLLEIQTLINSLYYPDTMNTQHTCLFAHDDINQYCASAIAPMYEKHSDTSCNINLPPIDDILTDFTSKVIVNISSLQSGQLHIITHIFHIAGILIGLAQRYGISTPLQLPHIFLRLFYQPYLDICTDTLTTLLGTDSNKNSNDISSSKRLLLLQSLKVTQLFAHAFRQGYEAIYPSITMKLLTYTDITRLFKCDSDAYVHVYYTTLLQKQVIYPQLLNDSQKFSIQLFWLATSELSYDQLDTLFTHLGIQRMHRNDDIHSITDNKTHIHTQVPVIKILVYYDTINKQNLLSQSSKQSIEQDISHIGKCSSKDISNDDDNSNNNNNNNNSNSNNIILCNTSCMILIPQLTTIETYYIKLISLIESL